MNYNKVIVTMNSGLDSRLEGQTLHSFLTPIDISKLESKKEDQVVHKSKGLGGMNNQNETTTSKQAGETNDQKGRNLNFGVHSVKLKLDRKLSCKVIRLGKKHLTIMKKFNHNNDGVANPK